MQRPFHLNGIAQHPINSQRILTIAFVAAIHLLAIFGLLVALVPATRHLISDPQYVPVAVVPTKPVVPALPRWQTPRSPLVSQPVVDFPPQRGDISTTPDEQRPPTTTSAVTAPSAVADTHTTPPYPEASLRLGEQGTVRLALEIASDGRVVTATVERSSGSAALDQAAANWVRAHWRYHPALKDGAPVSAVTEAEVRFDIRNAR